MPKYEVTADIYRLGEKGPGEPGILDHYETVYEGDDREKAIAVYKEQRNEFLDSTTPECNPKTVEKDGTYWEGVTLWQEEHIGEFVLDECGIC